MGASRDAEKRVRDVAASGLRRFLERARELVMVPFRRFGSSPDANAVYAAVPVWDAAVSQIMEALTPALREGWAAAHLPGDYSPSDPFIQANLALTRNLLVRVPDEVHAAVVRAVLEGANKGSGRDEIAARIDNALDWSGSENWPNRADVIAQTECNRHYNSSLLAHGLLVERQDGGVYMKEWQTLTDRRERPAHHAVDHQVRLLSQPYRVDDEDLLFPGDPVGKPENVINCRCGQSLRRVDV